MTWLWDSVAPIGIRVYLEQDTKKQMDHTQTRGPWPWGMMVESKAVHVLWKVPTQPSKQGLTGDRWPLPEVELSSAA